MPIQLFILLLTNFLSIGSSYPQNFQNKGIASYYHDKFHGRTTANGEIYHKDSLTAAHRSLPFQTYVKVTNLSNNKSVIVKINDRGPFVKGRIIDVSKAAASQLGIIKQGVAKVSVEIIKPENPSIESKSKNHEDSIEQDP